MPETMGFENLVNRFYAPLYQFAFILSRSEAEASELTIRTFHNWAKRGQASRDIAKLKLWLFSSVQREFLKAHRPVRHAETPELDMSQLASPIVGTEKITTLEATRLVELLGRVSDSDRAPLTLFYMEDFSYPEIAEILDLRLELVQAHIVRGQTQLQRLLGAGQTSEGTAAHG